MTEEEVSDRKYIISGVDEQLSEVAWKIIDSTENMLKDKAINEQALLKKAVDPT